MTTHVESGLFELDEVPPARPGDKVIIQTIWGDEPAVVEEVGHDDEGRLLYRVKTRSVDTITAYACRVRRAP